MAQTEFWPDQADYWLPAGPEATMVVNTIDLNDLDNAVGVILPVPEAGEWAEIGFMPRLLSGSMTYRGTIEGLTALGQPDGIVARATAAFNVTSLAQDVWTWRPLTSFLPVTVPGLRAVMLRPVGVPDATNYIRVNRGVLLTGRIALPHPIDFLTAWTKRAEMPGVAVKDALGKVVWPSAFSTFTKPLVADAGNPGGVGIEWSPLFSFKSAGIRTTVGAGVGWNVKVWETTGGVYTLRGQTGVVPQNELAKVGLTQIPVAHAYFNAGLIEFRVGRTYIIAIFPNCGSIRVAKITCADAAVQQGATSGGRYLWRWAQTADGGATLAGWSFDSASFMPMALMVSEYLPEGVPPPSPPNPPTNPGFRNVTSSSAEIFCTDNSTDEDGFGARYKRTTDLDWIVVSPDKAAAAGTGSEVFWLLTGLVAGTYQAEMFSKKVSGGESTHVSTGFTISSPPSEPVAPTLLTAIAVSATHVRATYGNVANEFGFVLQSSPAGAGVWTDRQSAPADQTQIDWTTATPASTYDIRVASLGAGTNKYPSTSLLVTTPALPASSVTGSMGLFEES